MVLAIGSDGFGVGLGALASSAAATATGRRDAATDARTLPSDTTSQAPAATGSPALTGLKQPLLAPGSIRQAQEQPPGTKTSGSDLSPAQAAEVAKLQQIDQSVRRHEQAHAATGGEFAGAPTYSYVQGPDGQRYAVAGEVAINASPVSGNPAATIRKESQVIAAALAPADPSGQDRAVAASAQQLKQQAEAELTKKQQEQTAAPGPGQGRPSSGLVGAGNAVPGLAAYHQAVPRNSTSQGLDIQA